MGEKKKRRKVREEAGSLVHVASPTKGQFMRDLHRP